MTVSNLWADPIGFLSMGDVSDTVRDACSACGGPRMIRYEDTDHGHAAWCPYYNDHFRLNVFGATSHHRLSEPRRRTSDADVLVARGLWAGGSTLDEISEALTLPEWVIRKWVD